MDVTESKIVAIIALALSSLFVGLLPACLTTYGRNRHPLIISGLLCFGGGVLLSTSLVHMLPETRENLLVHKDCAEILFAVGFFLLYFLDELVHSIYPTHGHGHSEGYSENTNLLAGRRSQHDHRSYDAMEDRPLLIQQPSHDPSFFRYSVPEPGPSQNFPRGSTHEHTHIKIDIVANSNKTGISQPSQVQQTQNDQSLMIVEDENSRPDNQICNVPVTEPCRSPTIDSFALLIALCMHSALEGLAIGLEVSSSQVLLLFGAIATHKLVVGFCLGMELALQNGLVRHFILILIFSLGSPMGIGLGMLFKSIPNNVESSLMSILQGLAGGTLFYVSVSEVIPRERAKTHKINAKRCEGLLQFACVVLGFVVMTLLTKYMDD